MKIGYLRINIQNFDYYLYEYEVICICGAERGGEKKKCKYIENAQNYSGHCQLIMYAFLHVKKYKILALK